MEIEKQGKRWTSADWADQKETILIIGNGGLGSWTALSLGRIDHDLVLVDGDMVDSTNVSGGQAFMKDQVGKPKCQAVKEVCKKFGVTSNIEDVNEFYNEEMGTFPITICTPDNMKCRKQVFEQWVKDDHKGGIFIDSRLLLEHFEIFCLQYGDEEAAEEYRKNWLFDDDEVEDLLCTAKQTTFSAMMAGGLITSCVCNFLTNKKLGEDFREVPFHQKFYLPIFKFTKTEQYAV